MLPAVAVHNPSARVFCACVLCVESGVVETLEYVKSALLGVFIGLFIWERVLRRREARRAQEDRAGLELAWSRDLWARITALGPLLSDLRSAQARFGGYPVERGPIGAIINQASDDYQRSLEEAVQRFPATRADVTLMDAVFRVSLAWTAVEFHHAGDEILRKQIQEGLAADAHDMRELEEMPQHLDAHREALGIVKIMMANKYPELAQPEHAAGPAAAAG